MSAPRASPAGKTRACPHCKATILESASVCPACRHYLRFDASAQPAVSPSMPAFRVEGVIQNPEAARQWEYAVVVSIRNDAGEELRRQVVSLGALEPLERRSFSVSVEVFGASDLGAQAPGIAAVAPSPRITPATTGGPGPKPGGGPRKS
jgi:uncharacterized protein YbaR (Trm112 family)